MNKSNIVADYPDAVNLWRSLMEYLKVEIVVEAPEILEPRAHAKVKITATNTAPSGPDWPDVAFMKVELGTGDPTRNQRGGWEIAKPVKTALRSGGNTPGWSLGEHLPHGAVYLLSGESIAWEIACPAEQLPELQPRVESYIAWDMFFRTDQKVPIPSIYTRPAVSEYIQAFGSIKFWDTFSPKLKSIHLPGPDTPFVQVQALTRQMTDSLASIETTIESLSEPRSAAIGPEARGHLRASVEYLYEERRVRQELNQAIASADTHKITQAANSIRNLEVFESAVNRAAEELVAKYIIPEQEAHGLWVR
ncbi:MAG: hypothetical protein Q7K03_02810 [Dehalococcoidia bacterium]|nr:hypothetical protein [Dehalococcoidia bacterium]